MAVKLGNGNWAVKEDKLLAYNDNSGLFFNKEFDFSRGTSATYVAKDGLIKTAGIQPNIVTNGDFATDSDWTKGAGWSIANGVASITSSTTDSIYQDVLTLGKTYKVQFEITEISSGSLRVGIGVNFSNYFTSTGVYTYIGTPTTDGLLRINPTSGTTAKIDNVIAQEIQTDTPRIDFTNDTKGHLLLEPSTTNLIPYSEDFSNSAWTKERATISANTSTSPDGSVNASKIIENTANGVHSIYEGVAISNNIYTFSCFVKKSDRDYCFLQIVTNLGRYTAVFDLVNGVVTDTQTVSSPTNTSNKIEDYGNGWYRVSVTSSNTASTTGYFQVGLSDSATPSYSNFKQPTYAGDGSSSIQIWGAQAEAADYPTSLIYTTGAASTRNADVCNNSGSAQDFNSEEGVLYAEIAALADDGTSRQMAISDGSTSNRVILQYHNTSNLIRAVIVSGGSTQADMSYTVSDTTEFIKIAITYKQNDFGLWTDGVKRRTDLVGNAPSGLDRLNFDRGDGSTIFIQAKVRNVQVFTEALTDEQLEKLTS